MIPYASFLYFGVALYVVVPTVVMRAAGRLPRMWIACATVAMLVVHYAYARLRWPGVQDVPQLWSVGAYGVFEWAVASVFLRTRAVIAPSSRVKPIPIPSDSAKRAWAFCLALTLALLPLVVVKTGPLFVSGSAIGFIGISYVTFRTLDVLIGIQDGLIHSLPPVQYLTYVFFFPTISSGPIDRYRRFDADWNGPARQSRADFWRDLDGAVHHLFTGFCYSFVVAVLIKRYWLDPATNGVGVLHLISYTYAYSAYLFFDFAGYSAFAIGLSYVFGVHTPENFKSPFLAENITEFWNRWHISLSHWFRDHVYMRFLMAAVKHGWFRDKYLAASLGLLLSMTLMGIWHGIELHYLVYGIYEGALLVGHQAFVRWNKHRRLWGDTLRWRAAAVFVTFHCVCFGLLLFSGHLFR